MSRIIPEVLDEFFDQSPPVHIRKRGRGGDCRNSDKIASRKVVSLQPGNGVLWLMNGNINYGSIYSALYVAQLFDTLYAQLD